MTPFPGKLEKRPGRMNALTYVLTDEQREWLCRWYPVTENPRLMKASGMTHSTLHRFARQYGLVKSEKGIRAIKRRQAAHIKRVCEKNGWYDSLRGRKPHPNTAEGTRRMWQEIRDGKREHPFRIMKKQNPRRYRKYMQRKSEERRETIRMELIRMRWGLPRKTRIPLVVMQPYTKSQVSHRFNAKRRGYIIADTCEEGSGHRYTIYYTDTTPRSQIFEKNCEKDGFRFREWQVNS